MTGYKLSKSAVTKTARTVRNYGTDPKRKTPQQSRRVSSARGGGGSPTVAPAIITSGGNGDYTGDIVDDTGEVIESGVTLIPTRATAYDLPADSYVVAYKVEVETLGSGE